MTSCQHSDVFAMFDRDGDGLVTRQDINVVTRGLGLGLTQQELDRFMRLAGKVVVV